MGLIGIIHELFHILIIGRKGSGVFFFLHPGLCAALYLFSLTPAVAPCRLIGHSSCLNYHIDRKITVSRRLLCCIHSRYDFGKILCQGEILTLQIGAYAIDHQGKPVLTVSFSRQAPVCYRLIRCVSLLHRLFRLCLPARFHGFVL